MDLKIGGKRAIVTGGSRGIGRCCALALACEGASVCVVARDRSRLDRVVEEIKDRGAVGYAVVADLSTSDGCRSAVKQGFAALGGVDVLVNCAGAAQGGDILSLPMETINEALTLKSYGYLRMAQLVIPFMKRNGWGRIVNIAGAAGMSPERGNLPVSLANVAILNMTRSLSDAVATDSILVNAICPGLTNTDRARQLYASRAADEHRDVDELIIEAGRSLPAGRIAEPEEIAKVAVFLASGACSYVFGSSVYMDGGARRSTP